MRYTMHLNPSRYAQLAVKAFGIDPTGKTDEETALAGIAKLEEFWSSIGAPRKLKDFDIDDSKIELMAEKAAARLGQNLYQRARQDGGKLFPTGWELPAGTSTGSLLPDTPGVNGDG